MSAASVRDKTEEVVDSVSQSAHDVVDTIDNTARAGIEKGRRKALDAATALDDLEAQAELTIEQTSARLSRYVREKPLQAAGVAFAAGVLTTLILRKR